MLQKELSFPLHPRSKQQIDIGVFKVEAVCKVFVGKAALVYVYSISRNHVSVKVLFNTS